MSPGNADAPSDLLARAESIAHEFDFKSEDARRLTEHFVQHMKNALRQDDSPSQIPSYVTKVPTGSEKGVFLAVDLGGTNCRVCSVRLHGDGTYALVQAKHAIPRALTADTSHRPLFDFVAEKIRDFLQAHPEADVDAGDGEGDDGRSHGDPADDENADNDGNDDEDDGEAQPNRRRPGRRRRHNDGRPRRQLGFTFSFTYEQLALDRGRVLFWDKGWDLPSAVGKDPCELLQEAIDGLGLPVAVAALANDSVGTLLTRAYTTGGATVTTTPTTTTKEQGPSGRPARGDGRRTLIGAIFGTGTNAAYVERARAVTRGCHHRNDTPGPNDVMVINTEWGGFGDGAPALLPTTAYDADLDAAAPHPGRELLEKRVSGLYLGEILRRALACLATEGRLADLALPAASPLFAPAGLDSALLSHVARGGDNDDEAAAHIARALGIEDAAPVVVGPHHVRAVRCLARAVARRAARLAGAALAAVILQSDEARRAAALETAPPPPLAIPQSSQAAPTRPRWTTGGAASASASPDGKIASLYRRFRTFVHGLMRSLGLQWAFTPPAPPGAGGGDREDGPGPGDEPKEADEPGVVEIGVDGSLVEFYPTFEAEMREAIRDVLGPAQERRVRIGLAKDGSGVGAALMALAASMQS